MSTLNVIRIYSEIISDPLVYFVTEGFIDMASNNLTILAQNAIEKDQLDKQKLNVLIETYQKEIDITDNDSRKIRTNKNKTELSRNNLLKLVFITLVRFRYN